MILNKVIKLKKILLYLALFFLSSCQINYCFLPGIELEYLYKYHCWPYEVTVYSFEGLKYDSLFYTYPRKSIFELITNYLISTWAKYQSNNIDTLEWYGMDKTLEHCDENIELYLNVLSENSIYYAGYYKYFKNKSGKKKRKYERIVFLDSNNKKLHIFNDINKVF